MKREELTQDELIVLSYWTNRLDADFNRIVGDYSSKWGFIKSQYRNIRLYKLTYSSRQGMVLNIKQEYLPVIKGLLEKKILTTFEKRGGEFYQLSKAGFEMFYGTGKDEK